MKKNILKIILTVLLSFTGFFINNIKVYAANDYTCTYGNVVKINVKYKDNKINKLEYITNSSLESCGTRENYCYRPTFNNDKSSSEYNGTLNIKKWGSYFENGKCPVLYAKVISNCEMDGCFHDYTFNQTQNSDYTEILNPYNSNTINNCPSNLVNEFNKTYENKRFNFTNLYTNYIKEIDAKVGITKAEYEEYKAKVKKDCAKVEQDYKEVYLNSYSAYGLDKCNFSTSYTTLKTQIDNEIKNYNETLDTFLKDLVYEGLGTGQMTEEEVNNAIGNSNSSSSNENTNPDINLGDPVEVNCEGILGQELIDFLNKIFRWIQILAPIFVIIISGVDFAGAILQDDKDAMKKASNKFIKRLIIAVALFFIPLILTWLLNIFNDITGAASSTCGIGE